ncbi:MAG TPA: porin [Thermoanaerobaculia bacterium]
MKTNLVLLATLFFFVASAQAQTADPALVEALKRLKITGYVQAQYVQSEPADDQFSVRRGRVKFTYQVNPTSRFVVQPDFSSSGVTLKDAYVELSEPWTSWRHTLTAGQFKWPFGFEVLYSSSEREMPERSRVIRTLFPGERDRGVMFSGRGFDRKLRYDLAIVNGNGTETSSDDNERKDLVGRLGYDFGAFDIGASVYRGAQVLSSDIEADKQREGVDVQWATPLPGFSLRGEYVRGIERGLDVDGWYVYAIQKIGARQQLTARLDEYEDVETIGGSYVVHWDTNSKVMLAYEDPSRGADVWTLRYQFSF